MAQFGMEPLFRFEGEMTDAERDCYLQITKLVGKLGAIEKAYGSKMWLHVLREVNSFDLHWILGIDRRIYWKPSVADFTYAAVSSEMRNTYLKITLRLRRLAIFDFRNTAVSRATPTSTEPLGRSWLQTSFYDVLSAWPTPSCS